MLKEFKAFAMQGNMLDMAIGIIIGAAFGTIVTSLVNDILMPLLAIITNSPDFSNLFVLLKAPEGADVNMASVDEIRKAGGVVLAYGVFTNAVISFLIVALALFFVVKGMNKMKKAEAPAPAPAPAGPTTEELLAEIRDLLKKG
ncbi:MAG: large conductance mechanosensitive channel protein MscL [Haliscomenobacter sp.]|nr:large conductance mechanosensitive channel protein MscL [Haliscomenobacter sp.]MBK8877822.1 large conductance mechanosensitive channel protein MscL [Haliscomenobacter sp.]